MQCWILLLKDITLIGWTILPQYNAAWSLLMFDSSQTEQNASHHSTWFAQHAKRTNGLVMGQSMPHPKGRRQNDVSKPQDGVQARTNATRAMGQGAQRCELSPREVCNCSN